MKLPGLATTIIHKYQSQNDLDSEDPGSDPADLVVGVVLVQIGSLAIIDYSEKQADGIEEQEQELRWEGKARAANAE